MRRQIDRAQKELGRDIRILRERERERERKAERGETHALEVIRLREQRRNLEKA